VRGYAVSVLERADDEELQCYLLQLVQALRFERSDKSRLALFLVNRALSNIEIASFLRWYILVELHSPAYARRYYGTYDMLENSMMKPIRSPLAPTLLLTGVVPQESSIFKSALNPLRLTFKTANGGTSKIIYKKGDDLQQDQLVIQTVSLMDRLLKLENLDLHLTPYRDLIALVETGSGKTGTFMLPILQKLLSNRQAEQSFFACVLSLMRELRIQIVEQFEALGSTIGLHYSMESENLEREMSSLKRQSMYKRKLDSSVSQTQKLFEDKFMQGFEGLRTDGLQAIVGA
ncbi:hypothetical protein ACJX0J_041492, partial [Zea mays]